MALQHSPSIVTEGLSFCVDAANIKSYVGSGATWSDISGRNNNLTLINSPTFNPNNSGFFTFNGSTNYATIATGNPAFDFATTNTPLTVEAWVNVPGNSSFIVTEGYTTGTNNVNFNLQLSNGSTVITAGLRPTFGYYNGSGWIVLYGLNDIPTNTWTQIVGVFTGSAAKLYVNGAEVSVSGSINSWTTSASDSLFIGRRWDTGGSPFFNGSISNVKVYNGVGLTAQQVLQNYNALKVRFNLQ